MLQYGGAERRSRVAVARVVAVENADADRAVAVVDWRARLERATALDETTQTEANGHRRKLLTLLRGQVLGEGAVRVESVLSLVGNGSSGRDALPLPFPVKNQLLRSRANIMPRGS